VQQNSFCFEKKKKTKWLRRNGKEKKLKPVDCIWLLVVKALIPVSSLEASSLPYTRRE